MTIGQILRLRQQTPALLEAARYIGFVGDVIVGRLCGRRAHDPTSLAIAMLYNPWLGRADPEILARLGIEEEPVARSAARPPRRRANSTQEASRQTGLRAGIPVSPAIHDQYAVSLGAGAVREGDVTFGAGTAWVLLANSTSTGAAGHHRGLRLSPSRAGTLWPDACRCETAARRSSGC